MNTSRRFLVLVLLSICGLLTNLDLQAATYFVAPAGNDGDPGTGALPFATIQHAADIVNPGDTVTVEPGTYVGAKFYRSGVSGAQIVFQAQPGVVVNAPGSLNTNNDNLWIRDASYITIDGFESTSAPRSGIAVQGEPAPGEVHGIVIQNNNCHNNGVWGIFTGYAEGVHILNNTTTFSSQQHGIYVSNSADNPVITGNLSHDNNDSGIQINADPALAGDGIISNALVDSNIVYNNGVGGGAAINLASVINSQISNNLLYNNHASGIAGWDDGDGTQWGTHDNYIYNNTVVQASGSRWALSLKDGSTNNHIKNNILLHLGTRGAIEMDATSEPGTDSDYNAVVDLFTPDDGATFLSLSQWQARGHDQHSFVSDSSTLFVNAASDDYHLSPASPAIDAGTTVTGVTVDLEGTPRPQGSNFDIGAYEAILCAGDTTSPSTSITAPANNATVGGTILIAADASDDCRVSKVEFYVDGSLVGADTSSPYSLNWDSRSVINGAHSLISRAYDAANHQTDSAQVSITVSNTDLFFDDFEDNDASDWTFVKGQWSAPNGALTSTTTRKSIAVSPNFGGCSQCTIESTLQIETALSRASVIGWYQNKSTYVEVALFDDKNRVKLKQKSNGTTVAKKSASVPISAGVVYDVQLTYDGVNFVVSIDGTMYLTVAAVGSPTGLVGFKVAIGSAAGSATSHLEQIVVD